MIKWLYVDSAAEWLLMAGLAGFASIALSVLCVFFIVVSVAYAIKCATTGNLHHLYDGWGEPDE